MHVADYLWAVACLVQIAWVVRLQVLGLVKRYKVLFAYLIASVSMSGLRWLLDHYLPKDILGIHNVVGWFWVVSVPMMWVLEFCLLVDLGTRLVESYSGLKRLGQIVISVSAVATGGLFLAMTVLDVSVRTWGQFWRAQGDAVDFSLTALCFVVVGVMTLFRLPVKKNLKITIGVFGIMAAINVSFRLGGALWDQLDPAVRPLLVSTVAIAAYGGAAALFSKAGEELSVPRPVVPQHAPAQAGAAIKEVNEVLVKMLRS